jgi:hypothetical protein
VHPSAPEHVLPTALDLRCAFLDDLGEFLALGRHSDDTRSAIALGADTFDVAALLQAGQEVVDRLLRHQRALGELRRAYAVRPGGLEDVYVRRGDVVVAAGAVTNPTAQFAGAIHIYGGDFFSVPRSEWRGQPYREQPYDVDYVLNYFEEANRAHPVS